MSLILEDARLPVIEWLCHYAVARSVKVNGTSAITTNHGILYKIDGLVL